MRQVEHLGTGESVAGIKDATRCPGWAVAGASMVGLSLPVPLLIVGALLTGRGGIAAAEPAGSREHYLPGLGGTARLAGLERDPRQRRGSAGCSLALFAALTWRLAYSAG
jgi:hypothetical protein